MNAVEYTKKLILAENNKLQRRRRMHEEKMQIFEVAKQDVQTATTLVKASVVEVQQLEKRLAKLEAGEQPFEDGELEEITDGAVSQGQGSS